MCDRLLDPVDNGGEAGMTSWYYTVGQGHKGPYSEEEIRYLIILGQIGPDTNISKDEMTTWEPGRSIPRFSHTFSKHAPRRATSTIVTEISDPAASLASHPFPRFLARAIDILFFGQLLAMALGAWAIVYAPSFFLEFIVKYGGVTTVLILPVAFLVMALCMTLTGTTPGKAIVGVRVPVPPGRNRLWFYLKRELKVWSAGLGIGILIAALYTASRQYRRLVSGRPASYDEGSTFVTANPTRRRVGLAIMVAALLLLPPVYILVDEYTSVVDNAATTQTWVNPLTGKTATIAGVWQSEPLKPAIDGVFYFVADDLRSEAIFAHETLPSTDVDAKTYAEAIEEAIAPEVVFESEWVPIEIEGLSGLRAAGRSAMVADVEVEITVVVRGGYAWRTLTFIRGGTSDQVAENEFFVSAMFASAR